MPASRTRARTVDGTAVRALGHALGGSALAGGLHHALTDSAISWPALTLAAAVLTVAAYAVLRAGTPRWSILGLAGVQAFLPAWLGLTDTDLPTAASDGHRHLPSAWHHNTVVMAAMHFLAALALAALFRGAGELPARLSVVFTATARRWRDYLLIALGPAWRALSTPAPPVAGPALVPSTAPPQAHSLTVLLDRVQPCAP
ncbi:hypothetical protein ABZW03_08370 [Kitasatospora sp. NPDC004799]|uniref:hypothetical protein n=1 Tax=Kitasatospora sp. NPDC004799 TaxID=3154460 RepID=UPI0033B03D28